MDFLWTVLLRNGEYSGLHELSEQGGFHAHMALTVDMVFTANRGAHMVSRYLYEVNGEDGGTAVGLLP